MDDDALVMAILGGAAIFMVIIFAILIVLFILNGLGQSYVLKKLGCKNAWVGWIPYVGSIFLGLQLRDEEGNLSVLNNKINGIAVALWPVYTFLCPYIPVIGTLLGLACSILLGGSVYAKAYAEMEGKDQSETQALGYVSGVFGIVATVKFLTYRSQGKKQG